MKHIGKVHLNHDNREVIVKKFYYSPPMQFNVPWPYLTKETHTFENECKCVCMEEVC